jgi:hypothetical protein
METLMSPHFQRGLHLYSAVLVLCSVDLALSQTHATVLWQMKKGGPSGFQPLSPISSVFVLLQIQETPRGSPRCTLQPSSQVALGTDYELTHVDLWETTLLCPGWGGPSETYVIQAQAFLEHTPLILMGCWTPSDPLAHPACLSDYWDSQLGSCLTTGTH